MFRASESRQILSGSQSGNGTAPSLTFKRNDQNIAALFDPIMQGAERVNEEAYVDDSRRQGAL